ncbi:hypothetical protein [Nocardia vinacea]|uniref:hypothetical protein n=1 Tax=Nocardia vinacea TaxID=96468 RepID=UPI0002F834B5|nr:hypothetical protein [Nocardia vinacea]
MILEDAVEAKKIPVNPARRKRNRGRRTGMTPHGNRHSHRTLLEQLGTPQKLINERIGHQDSSVQDRYPQVTDAMVKKLMADLTEVGPDALD